MNNNILRALSEPAFLYLWLGEVFSVLATNIFNFFLILIVFNQTHSNTAVSGVVLSFTIPAIFFGSVAGGYVDRWNKKFVLIATNIARALMLVILAFFIQNLFVIYATSFMVTVFTQFFIPAEIPIIPLVTKKSNLLAANALFGMAIYGSILVAYVLSGPLIILLKSVNTLFFLVFLYIIGAGLTYLVKLKYIKNKPELTTKPKTNVMKDLRHTFLFISHTKTIYNSLFMLALSQILVLILATIAPGYAYQILGIKIEEFPLLFVAPAALGMVIGSIAMANIFHKYSKEKVITVGVLLSGLAMLFLPFGSKVVSRGFIQTLNTFLPHVIQIDILHFIVFFAFILGVANSLVYVPANTILQEKASDEIRGKIYGFLNTIVGVFSLLPIIIVGGLSDIIGVGSVIIGIGILLLVGGIVRVFSKNI
jgi:MFS family permease